MIRNITLANFQSHEKTELDLSPGINVIVGSSSAGKTSILRALIWALFNSPSGKNFIRKGQTDVYVSVIFSDGFAIAHERTKKIHIYELVTKDAEATFEAFGTSVPKEITQAVRMSDINIQRQLEPHFLALQSPGEIARYIRKTAGIDDIDKIVSSLHSRALKSNAALVSFEERIAEVDEELEELNKYDFKLIELKLGKHDKAQSKFGDLTVDLETITGLLEDVKSIDKSIPYLPATFDDDIAKLRKLAEKYDRIERQLPPLGMTISSIVLCSEFLSSIPSTFIENVERLTRITTTHKSKSQLHEDIEDILISLDELGTIAEDPSSLIAKLRHLKDSYIRLAETAVRLRSRTDEIAEQNSSIKALSKKQHALIVELADLQDQLDVCPTCGQKLTSEALTYLTSRRPS